MIDVFNEAVFNIFWLETIDSIFAPRRCEMEKHQFAVAQFECYSKGEKISSDFIKCLGYKFGAVI
jgi:hypothetical protein